MIQWVVLLLGWALHTLDTLGDCEEDACHKRLGVVRRLEDVDLLTKTRTVSFMCQSAVER